MSFYSRNRVSSWALVILVVLNLALLITLWYPRLNPPAKQPQVEEKKPAHDRPVEPGDRKGEPRDKRLGDFLKRELNFTQEQVDKFMELREEHLQTARQSRRQINDLRNELMGHLLDEQLDTDQVEALAEEIGQKTARLETSVFYHFLDLMEICEPGQELKYRQLLRVILDQLKPPGHGGPAPPDRRQESGHEGISPGMHEREDRREPPQRDERPGQEQSEPYFFRLRRQLNLTARQEEKIRPLVESAFQELRQIPRQYRSHEERRQAMERVHRQLDDQIEALLTRRQKEAYAKIKEERNQHPPPPRSGIR
jgi:Spy/CpxP family protein refolding chaperone